MPTEDFIITPAIKRAKRFYRERVRPQLGNQIHGQWIVIDCNSGDFETGEDPIDTLQALQARIPNLEFVFVRNDEFTPGHLGGIGQVIWESMTQQERDSLPPRGPLNYKHYLYGFPKREKYPWQE